MVREVECDEGGRLPVRARFAAHIYSWTLCAFSERSALRATRGTAPRRLSVLLRLLLDSLSCSVVGYPVSTRKIWGVRSSVCAVNFVWRSLQGSADRHSHAHLNIVQRDEGMPMSLSWGRKPHYRVLFLTLQGDCTIHLGHNQPHRRLSQPSRK